MKFCRFALSFFCCLAICCNSNVKGRSVLAGVISTFGGICAVTLIGVLVYRRFGLKAMDRFLGSSWKKKEDDFLKQNIPQSFKEKYINIKERIGGFIDLLENKKNDGSDSSFVQMFNSIKLDLSKFIKEIEVYDGANGTSLSDFVSGLNQKFMSLKIKVGIENSIDSVTSIFKK